MNRSRSVTLADVSRDAGVSIMTVSNVVRGKSNLVRLETRKRVEESIARLNYRPNLSARSLRLSQQHSVGIVIADTDPAFLTDPFISRLVSGLSNYLSGRDYTSLLIDAKTFDRWTNQTASQIATTLAKRHGLTPKVTATTGAVGKIYEIDKIHDRHGSTEWELLTWLASIYDFVVYVQGMTLYFGPKPDPKTATPYALQWKNPDALTATTFEGNVLSMSFSRTLTVGKGVVVQVHSFNHKQKAGFSVTYPTGKAKGITPGTAKAPAQVYSYVIANLTQQDAQARAMKIYNDIIRHELKMSAELPGDNILTPNTMVSVSGTQTPFDTMYYVESVSRRMSFDSGYTMSVRGKNHSLDTTVIPS